MDGTRTNRGGTGGFGESTRRRTDLPPPTGAQTARPLGGVSAALGGGGGGGGGGANSSKNWQFRSVVSKRETLPPTVLPEPQGPEVPALWSTNVWGDVRRPNPGAEGGAGSSKRPKGGGGSTITRGGISEVGDIMHDIAAKESELRTKELE